VSYQKFLAQKLERFEPMGFEPTGLPPMLFEFQRLIVDWTVRRGRCAIFAGCGLGKTPMQLAWAEQVRRKTGRHVLVLAPLAVTAQTVREGEKFGVAVVPIKSMADLPSEPSVCVANYHKLLGGHIDAAAFSGVVLDESSILKSYMGKTKRLLIELFSQHEYRLCCTATPAPNDYTEIGNHSEFLGVMDSNEMLSRWFIADQSDCGNYRLKGHGAKDFWEWVSSWAVCIDRPSDVGCADAGLELPPLNVSQHIVEVDITSGAADGTLFRTPDLAATGLHREMRLTAEARAAKVAALVASPGPWIVWCNTNYEADALVSLIPGALEVRGSEDEDEKERKLLAFSNQEARVLVTKPSIAGFGMNWQHCAQVAFVGLSYSHEQYYQAVRRSWRFGQTRPVECHIVRAETEGAVLSAIQRKERDAEEMRAEMIAASRRGLKDTKVRKLNMSERDAVKTDKFEMILGDSCEVVKEMPEKSVDFTIFSPPFVGLYIYSEAAADMGNSADWEEFFRHYEYLAPELLRVTVPGRLCAVHCKDLPRYANRDGTAGLLDFPGALVASMEKSGWSFHSRVTVWKCPVTERERTNNNGLLFKTVQRDSTQLRMGMADYLLLFRRPPEDGLLSSKPIARKGGWSEYAGEVDPRTESSAHPAKYARKSSDNHGLAIWQRYAEPVWWDIEQTDTLNETLARESKDQKHICPLQLGLIRRALHIWSQPGDVVFSPFGGIGSEGVVSLQEGRRFVGVELKRAYWEKAVGFLRGVSVQPSLFAEDGAA